MILKDTMEDIKDAFKNTADRSVPILQMKMKDMNLFFYNIKIYYIIFKFIRGIQKYNETKIQNKYNEYNIIKREYNANPIQLYQNV